MRPEAERGEKAVVVGQLPVGRALDQDGGQGRGEKWLGQRHVQGVVLMDRM